VADRRCAQCILSDDPILYPYITRPDVLVVCRRKPTHAFADLKHAEILIVEQDLVHLATCLPAPASMASRLHAWRGTGPQGGAQHRHGRFPGRRHRPVAADALRNAVKDSVPPALEKLNLQAFDKASNMART